jgi:hypothetical protein
MAAKPKRKRYRPPGTPELVRVGYLAIERDLLAWLDTRAEQRGVSRNTLIAEALHRYREAVRPARKGTGWN